MQHQFICTLTPSLGWASTPSVRAEASAKGDDADQYAGRQPANTEG